jgi:exodeoxyribonuclease V beta subunit
LSARALDDVRGDAGGAGGGDTSAAPAPTNGDPDDPTLGDASDGDEQRPPPAVLFDGLGAGAAFGTLVHDALEHLDFSGDLDVQLGGFLSLRPWSGDAERRARLVAAIAAAVRTPLGNAFGSIALASLARSDRLDELEFEVPLATPASSAFARSCPCFDTSRPRMPALPSSPAT